jgi:hypothetical protein
LSAVDVSSAVLGTGAIAVASFDAMSHMAGVAHSTCTVAGPSVRTQSKALVALTSPIAMP